MSDLIHDDYRLLQVISRFGVSLGFGDQSVAAACKGSGVDATTFLAVVNFIQSEGRLSVSELAEQVSVAISFVAPRETSVQFSPSVP